MNAKTNDSYLINAQRRSFLKNTALLASLSPLGLAAQNTLTKEAKLHIIRNGTTYKIPFMNDGKLEENGYNELCRIFADLKDRVAVQMDPALFMVLSNAQQWLSDNHINRPIILTSGYRTTHTNNATEGAAFNSMHLYGKAADIKIEGIPSDYLARLLRLCGGSGLGIYPNFVHVDTWKVRHWRG